MARRRQIADRRKDQAGDRYDQRAEANNNAVDSPLGLLKPDLQPQLERAYVCSDELEILLRGEVVVDRVEDLGSDLLGLLAIDIRVGQGIGQGKPVGQRRLRSALRIQRAAESRCGTGRFGVDTLSVAAGILAQPGHFTRTARGG
jgi:hypothetical protein